MQSYRCCSIPTLTCYRLNTAPKHPQNDLKTSKGACVQNNVESWRTGHFLFPRVCTIQLPPIPPLCVRRDGGSEGGAALSLNTPPPPSLPKAGGGHQAPQPSPRTGLSIGHKSLPTARGGGWVCSGVIA